MRMIRRFPAILLGVTMLLLGSGVFSHLHDLQHLAEDARLTQSSPTDQAPAPHDQSNCVIHAILQAPMELGGAPIVVIAHFEPCGEICQPTDRAEPQRSPGGTWSRGPPIL